MKNRILAAFLALILAITVPSMSGCSVSQFEAVLNEVGPAVSTILQIVAIAKGTAADTSLATKIAADVAAAEKVFADLQASTEANKGSLKAQLDADFVTLNNDLSSVFAIAQVSNKNTQAKITALVGLVESAVQIAEAAIPSNSAKAVNAPKLSADELVDSFNNVLVAKTGDVKIDSFTPKHKIHKHGKLVRVLSLGIAK